jgi:hypothetical protein
MTGTVSVTLAATGVSPWIPVNRYQVPFGVSLFGLPSSGASVTWKVQHTADRLDSDAERPISISRAGTVATVTDPAHGLSVGDSVIIMGSGSSNLDGTQAVASIVDANTYTYTVVNTGATASATGTRGKNLRVFDHATLTGQTARADGNYAFPVTAVRLSATVVSGTVTLEILQGMGD